MRTVPRADRIVSYVVVPALLIVLLLGGVPGLASGHVPVGTPGSPVSPGALGVSDHARLEAHPSSFSRVWAQLPVAAPSPRSYYGSAWDPLLGGLLIFGGCVGGVPWGESTFCSTLTNETWAFVDDHWENLTGPVAPSVRVVPMMAYDPTEDGVLLFGGGTGPAASNCVTDTWLYDAAGWQQLFPATVPGCAQTGMDFDGNLGHILLLASASGTDDSAIENISWEFANGNWVQLSATSSFDRSNPMMMYDSTDKETVLFGGFDLSCGCQNLGDTWVFRQGAWTQIYPSQSPGARNEAAITDDPALGGLLLFGGHYADTYYNDTWLFHNGSWTQFTTPVAPSYRWAMQMNLDPTTGQVVLFGGYNFTNSNAQFNNETWTYAYPSPLSAVVLSVAPTTVPLGQEVAFSTGISGGLGDLSYVYHGLPPGCLSANLSLVVCIPTSTGEFGVQVNVTDQVGRFMSSATNLSVTPAVVAGPLTFSEVLAMPSSLTEGSSLSLVIVTSGGSGGNSYSFTALPTGCLTVDSPVLSCVPSGVGAFNVRATVEDSSGTSLTQGVTVTVLSPAPPPPGPTVVGLTAVPDPATVGELMVFEVQTTGGDGALTFVYTGLPAGCSSENSSVVLCTPTSAGAWTVSVSVTDVLNRASAGIVTATVGPARTSTGNGSGTGTEGGGVFSAGFDLDVALSAVGVAVVAGVVAVIVTLRARRPPTPPRTPGSG